MNKTLIILIGCSGCGKTTFADKLAAKNPHNYSVILSTDDIVCDRLGHYLWSADYLHESHKLNQLKAEEACKRGFSQVIIDNTNLTNRDRKAYEDIAKKYDYEVVYMEPDTEWKDDPEECARRSKHLNDSSITRRQLDKKEPIIE